MPNIIDYTGQRFGHLLVLSREPSVFRSVMWLCRCDCGAETIVRAGNLRSGNTSSCGCFRDIETGRRSTTHGQSVGYRSTPEHRAWKQALNRCRNPRLRSWKDYGGRGIRVCSEWEASFQAFFDYVGPRPSSKHSLDRIKVDGHYEPGNVRWATTREQSRNTRRNHIYMLDGQAYFMADLAEKSGINHQTIKDRLRRGWTLERAVSVPARKLANHF